MKIIKNFRKLMKWVIAGVIGLLLIILFLVYRPVIVKTDEIVDYLYGDRLVIEKNIPYSWGGISLYSGYSMIWAKYYALPKIEIENKDVEAIFLETIELPYKDGQLNPNKIKKEGGNCQSFSIYLVTAFRKMGYRAGFFVTPEHVSVWLIYDNMLWRVDAVTKEFARVSISDRLYLEKIINLEGID